MSQDDPPKARRRRRGGGDHAPTQTLRVVQPGEVLANRFEVVEKLGAGAMGQVFAGRDRNLDGYEVALKVLPPEVAGDKRARKRLQREALSSIQLGHPNIVRLHSFELDEDLAFLVMERVHGQTLDDELADREDERLEIEEVFTLAKAIGAALDEAHSKGIVHRDVKPANVLLATTDDGWIPKLADFGISQQVEATRTRMGVGQVEGTLLYIAPEVLSGQKATPAADQWALAVMLYECLTGETPFEGPGLSHKILEGEPPPLEGNLAWMWPALSVALRKDPTRRHASVGELVRLLERDREVAFRDSMHTMAQHMDPDTAEALGAAIGMDLVGGAAPTRDPEPAAAPAPAPPSSTPPAEVAQPAPAAREAAPPRLEVDPERVRQVLAATPTDEASTRMAQPKVDVPAEDAEVLGWRFARRKPADGYMAVEWVLGGAFALVYMQLAFFLLIYPMVLMGIGLYNQFTPSTSSFVLLLQAGGVLVGGFLITAIWTGAVAHRGHVAALGFLEDNFWSGGTWWTAALVRWGSLAGVVACFVFGNVLYQEQVVQLTGHRPDVVPPVEWGDFWEAVLPFLGCVWVLQCTRYALEHPLDTYDREQAEGG